MPLPPGLGARAGVFRAARAPDEEREERANAVRFDQGVFSLDRVLKDGAAKARAIAAPIMDEVKKTVGFVT